MFEWSSILCQDLEKFDSKENSLGHILHSKSVMAYYIGVKVTFGNLAAAYFTSTKGYLLIWKHCFIWQCCID
jgi:hypothetical protein